MATTVASVSNTNIPFSVAEPRKALIILEDDLSLVRPVFAFFPRQLMHGVYLVSIPVDKLSVVVSESEEAHQLRVGLRCFPCQHRINSFGIWSDTMFIHKAAQILE